MKNNEDQRKKGKISIEVKICFLFVFIVMS